MSCPPVRGDNPISSDVDMKVRFRQTRNSYTMSCPPVRGDNSRDSGDDMKVRSSKQVIVIACLVRLYVEIIQETLMMI